jgi:hypothetical protein
MCWHLIAWTQILGAKQGTIIALKLKLLIELTHMFTGSQVPDWGVQLRGSCDRCA